MNIFRVTAPQICRGWLHNYSTLSFHCWKNINALFKTKLSQSKAKVWLTWSVAMMGSVSCSGAGSSIDSLHVWSGLWLFQTVPTFKTHINMWGRCCSGQVRANERSPFYLRSIPGFLRNDLWSLSHKGVHTLNRSSVWCGAKIDKETINKNVNKYRSNLCHILY